MIIVLPRTLTLGLSADEIKLVILWFTKINERIRIVSADSPGMDLLDVARANELVHTNSRSCGSSSHVNPLPTPTTPEQVAIEEQATSILRDGIAPDIQRHLIAGFLPVEDEVDDLNKLHRTLLSINQEIRASGVPLTDIDRLSDMMTTIVKRRFPDILYHSSDSPCNVIALRTSPNGSSEKTSRRVQIGNTDSDDQINNDIIDEDDDNDNEEDDDEVNVGDRHLPEKQLVNCLAAIGYVTNNDYLTYKLHTLFGNGETRAQFAGMFTELIQFVLNNKVLYLIINQTTRVSNGTLKMALLLEICKQRGTQLVIASQYGVSPMSISKADQLRIEYRNWMWTSFRATMAKLSNNSSKLFQSILLKAWNEHCRLPATSLLQMSLIESDEMA
jgi:hypothetical protein